MPTSLKHAARRLLRARGFTLAAVLTLALGVGGSTAVFSVVNGVLLRPLPYSAPDQLVDLSHTLQVSGVTRVDQSDASYLYYRAANHVFAGVAGYKPTAVNLGGLAGAGAGDAAHAQRVAAARVSASLFGVLRVAPLGGGRPMRETEDVAGAAPVVLVGERLWRSAFGADPAIIGRQLTIDGVPHEIIGLLPATLHFPAPTTELWLPLGVDPAKTESATFDYRVVARLRTGVSVNAAQADLQQLLPRLPDAYPGRLTVAAIAFTKMRAVVRPLRDVVVGDIGRVLWVVLGAVGFVMLIACANVANLFLVRAESRRQELAVRRALGAGRRAIVSELSSEGIVLALLGGSLGLLFAALGVRVLRASSGVTLPRLNEVTVDSVVLVVALALSVLALVLVIAIPAIRAATGDASDALRDAGRTSTAGRRRHRARNTLVVAQTALALVLMAGAGLMARSFAELRKVKPGFDADRAWTVRVALPSAEYATASRVAGFVDELTARFGALPGVRASGAVTKLPLVDEARRDSALFVEDRPLARGQFPNVHQIAYATPGYFAALSIPLLEGRTFERPDGTKAPLEVILSRSVAARYWPNAQAIGRRVRLSPRGDAFTVVGVAGDVHGTGLDQPPDETVYLPLVTAPGFAGSPIRWTPRELAFVVRGTGDPSQLAVSIERAVRTIAPGVPVYAARSMSDVVSVAGARTTFTMLLLGIASAVAIVLGAVGIYGVISFVVSLRSREFAVRMAVGARPADVRRMVTRQGLTVAAIGIALGVGGALALTRFLGALLFGIAPSDPVTLGAAATFMLLVATAASWLPAGRAARVDPATALRSD